MIAHISAFSFTYIFRKVFPLSFLEWIEWILNSRLIRNVLADKWHDGDAKKNNSNSRRTSI